MNYQKKVNRWRWRNVVVIICTSFLLQCGVVWAEEDDPFDKKLIPLELVMEHRQEIGLSKAQQGSIGELVVALQKTVAEHQWEMQSAYFDLLELLDETPIDESAAIRSLRVAIEAENAVKLEQVSLLIQVRNLLTSEQIAQLRKIADSD